MRGNTLFFSLLLHAAVVGAIFYFARTGSATRATAFAVVSPEKKKAEPKPERPKPPPPPPEEKPRAREAADPQPKPAAPPPTDAPAPTPNSHPVLSTGLTLDNGPGADVGLDVGLALTRDPAAGADAAKGASGRGQGAQPLARRESVKAPPPPKGEDLCTEEPTKPVPLVRATQIEYPAQARASGIEGRLVLRVYVAADGSVIKVEVVESVDPSLDAAAIAAVRTWKFQPAAACGKPVSGGMYTLARRFELGD